ncbi:MAG: hypothetical protein J0L99_04425 [Chitinophagales bacterium]|nr:hypothetical protein [Chitinophagales bacterium]
MALNLDQFLVISGVTGVHKLVTTRGNGLIIEDRHEGRTRFVPVRQNQVTPLATVAVYTETEEGTVPLTEVFEKMLEQVDSTPPPPHNSASNNELRSYFSSILPEHDHDRVQISDIKKCIKWFNFMREKGIFEEAQKIAAEAAAAQANTEAVEVAEVTEVSAPQPETEAPAKKPAKAKKPKSDE